VICSFADAETRSVWEGRRSRRLPGDIQVPALRKLRRPNSPLTKSGFADSLRL
jgi:proteic killer suppression protein